MDWNWEQIRDRFGPLVWAVAMRILNHQADAFDCYQDVFLEVFQKSDRTETRDPGAYLRWLTTRRALDVLRKRQLRNSRTESNNPDAKMVPSAPGEKAEFDELLVIVRDELASLPSPQAQAFWLVSVEQRSYEEVAAQMEIERNHVGVLVHRARKHLQQRLTRLAPNHQH